MLKELVSKHQYNAFFCPSMKDFLEFVDVATDEMKFSHIMGPSGNFSKSYFGLEENKSYSDKELILAYIKPNRFYRGITDESYVLIIHGLYDHGQYYIKNDNEFSFLAIPSFHKDSYIDYNFKVFDASVFLRKKKLEKLNLISEK